MRRRVTRRHYAAPPPAVNHRAARLYAESQLAALSYVSELCEIHRIDCDLESQASYVVADSEQDVEPLDAEVEAGRRAGLPLRRAPDPLSVPFPAAAAPVLEDQAQFHVRKYLIALAGLRAA
jgi:FAD dependent oxidoreductase